MVWSPSTEGPPSLPYGAVPMVNKWTKKIGDPLKDELVLESPNKQETSINDS